MFPIFVRQAWFKVFHQHYSTHPNRIVQILFDIRQKLLCCTAATQNLSPDLNLLCQEFHQYVDIRQQQDLSDFYTIILDQVHDILNNDTQDLHEIDNEQQLLFQENLQTYFVRRTTKYWNVMRNSLLEQYQTIWTLGIMTCQFCLHHKCSNCACTRIKFDVNTSWLLHLDIAAAKPGVHVAFLNSKGKPTKTSHFEFTNLSLFVTNDWQTLLTDILHRHYNFQDITFNDNVITLKQFQEEICLLVYTTENVQKPNVLHRIVSHIHSAKTLDTFPRLLHFFDALTKCICFQIIESQNYYIPVAISQSPNNLCNEPCKVLALPYFVPVDQEDSIKDKLFQSHFLSMMNRKRCVIYSRSEVNISHFHNLTQWNVVWNKGKDNFNSANIEALQQGAEILVITSQHLPPFHVCLYILFDIYFVCALTCYHCL